MNGSGHRSSSDHTREDLGSTATASPNRIRILLADRSVLVRKILIDILGQEPDIEVVGEAVGGLEAVSLAQTAKPNLVLMDVPATWRESIEATERITRELPGVHVIGFSLHEKDYVGQRMMAAGAAAYLTKRESPERLLGVIREVIAREQAASHVSLVKG